MSPFRFGLALDFGARGDDVLGRFTDARRLIALAEELGFSSIWVGEGYPTRPGSWHLPSSLLVASHVAAVTPLVVGTGVLLLPAWQPLRLAYDTALLDRLTGGRFVLGVGAASDRLRDRFDVPNASIAARIDEELAALRALWRGADGYQGAYVTVKGPVFPNPVTPGGPPLWVGGRVRRSAERAAELGDGWYAASNYSIDTIARQSTRYTDACDALGKPRGVVAANRITAVALSRGAFEQTHRPFVEDLLRQYERVGALCASDTDAVLRSHTLTGTPDDVNSSLVRYRDAGVTEVQFRIWLGVMPVEMAADTMRLLGRHVLPAWS